MKIDACKSKIVQWDKNFGLLLPEKMLDAAGFPVDSDLLLTLEKDLNGKTRIIITAPDDAIINLPIKEMQDYKRSFDGRI